MHRLVSLLVVPSILATLLSAAPSAAKKKPRAGIFGTIHGRKFGASNLEGATDPCVSGIYKPAQGILVFSAVECRPKRRRQGATRKNYKVLVVSCTKFEPSVDTSMFPYEIPCPNSVYEENKTGRFGQAVSKSQWGANFEIPSSAIPTSNLHLRVDAFDGSTVRAALFGVFQVPVLGPGSEVPAQVSGEVQVEFPFKIQ